MSMSTARCQGFRMLLDKSVRNIWIQTDIYSAPFFSVENRMTASFYEAELQESLQAEFSTGKLRVLASSQPVFNLIQDRFPLNGSRIDWHKVPNSLEVHLGNTELSQQQFESFFENSLSRTSLSGNIVYVGDGLTDFAIDGSHEAIREALSQLLSVPQHHCFVGENGSWCICFTMEGDAGFGFSPNVDTPGGLPG